MGKVSYNNLKLKVDKEVTIFDFQGNEIEVLNYLPYNSKYDLLMITLQQSEENGIYNPVKLEMHFNLNLVYMYTNLSFTDKQREDEEKIYDCLKSQGFFYQFLNAINEEEYNWLFETLQELVDVNLHYRNTAGAVLQSIIQDLPRNAEAAANIVENFDKDKFKEVVDFAVVANGGRPIAGQI